MASLKKPIYKIQIIPKGSRKYYDVSGATIECTLTDAEEGFSYMAEIKMVNVKYEGKRIQKLIDIRSIVRIYVNTSKSEEASNDKLVFYGVVWQKNSMDETENTFTLTCYDNLIYLQKSEGSKFFKKNKKTKTIIKSICKSWNLPLKYSYVSVKHPKYRMSGDYSSFILETVMGKARRKTGIRGVVRSDKGVIKVMKEGSNKSFYTLSNDTNIISNELVETMEDVVTKVLITGVKKRKGKKSSKTKIAVRGNTKKWGTIQKVEDKGDRKLSVAKKEAKRILKDQGHPQVRRKITAYDIPFIRKGDRVRINDVMWIVKTITHNFHDRTMELEVAKGNNG